MATKQYMNVKTAAGLWGLTERRVRILCSEGRVDGVVRNGWAWNIPLGAPKPQDGRVLRHIKNTGMRPGSASYKDLDVVHAQIAARQTEVPPFLSALTHEIARLATGALAFDGESVSLSDMDTLYAGSFPETLSFENALLALNTRSVLLSAVQEAGLGPVKGGEIDSPYLSERKLRKLWKDLNKGIDDMISTDFRSAVLPDGGSGGQKSHSVEAQMATMLIQYEKEWQLLHPIVRSSFLFGELMRLLPFGEKHGCLFALCAMSLELIAAGYPPAVIDAGDVAIAKADLAVAGKRGTYKDLISFLGDSVKASGEALVHA